MLTCLYNNANILLLSRDNVCLCIHLFLRVSMLSLATAINTFAESDRNVLILKIFSFRFKCSIHDGAGSKLTKGDDRSPWDSLSGDHNCVFKFSNK